jgi:hypothetical protein
MAVTEVITDFTYTYDTIVELAGGGTETNPTEQDVFDTDDQYASSALEVKMGGQFASSNLIIGDASVIELQLSASLQTDNSGSLAKDVLQVSMEGSLAVTNSLVGGALSILELKATGTMHVNPRIYGNASVVEVQMEGSAYVGNNLSMDKELIILSMEGLLVQGVDEEGAPIIIPAPDDGEYPNISGEEYIVLNLRTKAHATYRDGERTAVAKTASMNFGSYTDKAVSDLFLLSRAKGEMEVMVNTKEDVERRYPLTWGETTQASLKNKKLPLGKGLKGANWSISIVVPDESHLEVRGLELFVTDLKRHV